MDNPHTDLPVQDQLILLKSTIDEQTHTIKQLEEHITELQKSKGELQSGINSIATMLGKHVEKTPEGILKEMKKLNKMLLEILDEVKDT